MKRWLVTAFDFSPAVVIASTRGKAIADTWRCDAFSNYAFGDFLKHVRCRRDPVTPPRWGDPITVLSKPAFFMGENGQYVQFSYPDSDVVLNAHPYDVEPVSYRPRAYQPTHPTLPEQLPEDGITIGEEG